MFSPKQAWKELPEKEDKNNEQLYNGYLYPLLGLIALFAFIGACIQVKDFDTAIALKWTLIQLAVYIIAFYLSAYLVFYLWCKHSVDYDGTDESKKTLWSKSLQFIGYASAWIYFTSFFLALFPSYYCLSFFMFMAFITLSGICSLYFRKEDRRIIYIFALGIIIILIPFTLYNASRLLLWGM
jgi:hypothetical protein